MIEKVVSSARLKSDPIARQLIDYFANNAPAMGLGDCIIYYDFPLFRDYEESLYQPTLLVIDRNKGVISIRVVSTEFDIQYEDSKLGELHSILFSKLLSSRRLRQSRSSLNVELNSILYLPPGSAPTQIESENIVISSTEGLSKELTKLTNNPMGDDAFSEIRSIIEGVKALTKVTTRDVPADGSKPKALVMKKLDEEISNFDANQRMAALTVPIGPQRIRGLAGSGKTIVLAWKAAHLHMQEPHKKILITFYTRSLYDVIRKQITRFYRHFKDADPNWDNLHVLHAWGGRHTRGVYYDTCLDYDLLPKQWNDVKNKPQPFQFVCEELQKKITLQSKYDMILADEAQDFPEAYFHLLFKLAHGSRDDKRIIWAYDELQSIFEPKMRSARELFGVDKNGEANIDLDRAKTYHGLAGYVDNDLILKKCYRNPLDVLVCSHALGLGIYGPHIVQMLQNREHWEDVGYEVETGNFAIGDEMIISRPAKNSPLSIATYEKREEIIRWHCASTFAEELDWIVNEAQSLIKDGLVAEDILIICLDDLNAKNYFSALSKRFAKSDILTNDLLANPFSTPEFVRESCITLSTVHRAKGNEAAAVLVCGVDAVAAELGRLRARNKLFTAFTRTKGWLRVSGLTSSAPLFEELQKALSNSPKLVFSWPDLAGVETLQRDLSKKEEKVRKIRSQYINQLAELGLSEDDALLEFAGQEKSE